MPAVSPYSTLFTSTIASSNPDTAPTARSGTNSSSRKSGEERGSSAIVGATKCPWSKGSPLSCWPPSTILPSRRAPATPFRNRSTAAAVFTRPQTTTRAGGAEMTQHARPGALAGPREIVKSPRRQARIAVHLVQLEPSPRRFLGGLVDDRISRDQRRRRHPGREREREVERRDAGEHAVG